MPEYPLGQTHVVTRELKWSYYQNVVDSSYSFVWWDFARWEIEIGT
jgi:alpha-N-acetylglucosaminidase